MIQLPSEAKIAKKLCRTRMNVTFDEEVLLSIVGIQTHYIPIKAINLFTRARNKFLMR